MTTSKSTNATSPKAAKTQLVWRIRQIEYPESFGMSVEQPSASLASLFYFFRGPSQTRNRLDISYDDDTALPLSALSYSRKSSSIATVDL